MELMFTHEPVKESTYKVTLEPTGSQGATASTLILLPLGEF